MKACITIIFVLAMMPALGQAGEMMTDTTGRLHSRLRPRAGLATMYFSSSDTPYWQFQGTVAFRVGFEAETLLKPNSKWSIPVFLDYEWYNTNTPFKRFAIELDFVSFGISGRRYFNLDDKTSFFLNAGILYGVTVGEPFSLSLHYSAPGMTLGAGFLMGRLSAEMNYSTGTLTQDKSDFKYNYAGTGLIFSYTISN